MTYILLLLVCVVCARMTIFVALPWMARKASLYCLHGLRERLYRIGESGPSFAETLFFQDLEFIICVDIHVCRDLADNEVRTLARLRTMRLASQSMSSWRTPVYKEELSSIYASAEGADALLKMFDIFQKATFAVWLRAASTGPLVLALGVPVVWVVVVVQKVASVLGFPRKPQDQVQAVSSRVETMADFVKQPRTQVAA